MKMMNRLIYSLAFLLVISSGNAAASHGWKSIDETKQARVSYDVTPNLEINVEGKDVELIVNAWDKSEVEIVATIEFKGKDSDKIRTFLDDWQSTVENHVRKTSLGLSIDMSPDEPNKVQIGKRGLIVGYSKDELRIKFEINVPSNNPLSIKNAYDDILITGQFSNEVSVQHYSGNISGEYFEQLDLNLKYGKGSFHTIKKSEMELYEQELEIKVLGLSDIDAKYSKLRFNENGDMELNSYESKIELISVESLEGELKYGDLEIKEMFGKLEIKCYELDMDFEDGESLVFEDSKYSELEADVIKTITYKSSYEDKLEINEVIILTIVSKYSELEIGSLGKSILVDGYETDVVINSLDGSNIESIAFDGKYNKLNLTSGSVAFELKAELTYGDIDYPESKVERKIYIKENSKLRMELHPKSGEAKLRLDLKGYEMKAEIS